MSKPTDLRRLGTILLLGVIAGYGVRYVASRVSRSAAARPTGLIDWEQARTFALRVSQWDQAGIPDRTARSEQGTAYVCEGLTCRAPIDTPEALTSALATPSDATDAV